MESPRPMIILSATRDSIKWSTQLKQIESLLKHFFFMSPPPFEISILKLGALQVSNYWAVLHRTYIKYKTLNEFNPRHLYVSEVVLVKEPRSFQHEAIIATVVEAQSQPRANEPRRWLVAIERTPGPDKKPTFWQRVIHSRVKGGAKGVGRDSIRQITSHFGMEGLRLTLPTPSENEDSSQRPLFFNELLILTSIISKRTPIYDACLRNCYWFAINILVGVSHLTGVACERREQADIVGQYKGHLLVQQPSEEDKEVLRSICLKLLL